MAGLAVQNLQWVVSGPVRVDRYLTTATGETVRKRDVAAVAQLTSQELQIVGLVAEGLTNKEIAAQLFLSPPAVGYHLRKVFTKLGITSRAELIRAGLVAPCYRLSPRGRAFPDPARRQARPRLRKN